MSRYLVTGCAGFIGSTLTDALLAQGHEVIGVDCLTSYYDPSIKRSNIATASESPRFRMLELDLGVDDLPADAVEVDGIFHLAAQAGVRASWGREFATYTSCNVLATQRLLEVATTGPAPSHGGRATGNPPAGWRAPRVVYASSSSIYGDALNLPTREDALPAPVSPYGVTKLAAEHLCATYHRNDGIEAISLRFFTVFGERQRPDMAFNRFIAAALAGRPITVYGDGTQSRDFTYVGDIVAGLVGAMDATGIAQGVYNLGGGVTATVRETLDIIGGLVDGELDVSYGDRQPGDVMHTSADTSRARADLGFAPSTTLAEGLARQVAWQRARLA